MADMMGDIMKLDFSFFFKKISLFIQQGHISQQVHDAYSLRKSVQFLVSSKLNVVSVSGMHLVCSSLGLGREYLSELASVLVTEFILTVQHEDKW